MADNTPVKDQPKKEEKEIPVKIKKDTATAPTSFEDRAKIEAEVKMIKIGRDASGRWIWKRSDRLTSSDKKQRDSMLEKIRKGLKV